MWYIGQKQRKNHSIENISTRNMATSHFFEQNFRQILLVLELEQVHKCYMYLLFGCMPDDFWLCEIQNEVGTFGLSLLECKHWDEMIMLKLHKFAIEKWNSIDIVSSSYCMLVALVVVRPYSFWSNPAHGYQAMNGKYQQPNYYVQSQSQTKHTG